MLRLNVLSISNRRKRELPASLLQFKQAIFVLFLLVCIFESIYTVELEIIRMFNI